MATVPDATVPGGSQTSSSTFAPMYYDSPTNQMAFGTTVTSKDSLTASITAGSAYYQVTSIDVCNWVTTPPPVVEPAPILHPIGANPPKEAVQHEIAAQPEVSAAPHLIPTPPLVPPTRHLSAPVATSNGITPLAIQSGQFVRLWVTANVPKGSPLTPGKFSGTAVLKGQSLTETVMLQGTYLGTLMGNPIVQPSTVVPGEPVFVQASDATGKAISDSSVTVAIQDVAVSSRYYQFATPSTRTLVVTATRGALRETALATIVVQGTPLAFRKSISTPVVTEMPILQVSRNPDHYTATFTLGNTAGSQRFLVEGLAAAANKTTPAQIAPGKADATEPVASTPAVQSPAIKSPVDPLNVEFSNLVNTFPTAEVLHIEPQLVRSGSGTSTGSLTLAPIATFRSKPTATSYEWDFGDGQKATTQAPTVTHNYLSSIQPGKILHGFDVSCKIVHDNLTVKQSLALHSAYGLCRNAGFVVPPISSTAYATFQQIAFSGSMIVHNLEASPLNLTGVAVVPMSDSSAAIIPAPQFRNFRKKIVLPANSATAIGQYIALSQIQLSGVTVNGFTVHYMGAVPATGMPVRFSCTFRIPLSDSGIASLTSLPIIFNPIHWDLGAALQTVTSSTAGISTSGNQSVDADTNTVAITLSSNTSDINTLTQVQSAVQAGLTTVALKNGGLVADRPTFKLPATVKPATIPAVVPVKPAISPSTTTTIIPAITPATQLTADFSPWSPPPVAIGNECYPDNISDADAATASAQQLVCQLTNQTSIQTLPSSFQNAQAGDIILSPSPVGDGDIIAAMFKALTPPQHHGHSGIMTDNFYEITHCTAVVDRITKNLNTDSLGIPTSLQGDKLQYAWPGSLTQTVDDSSNSLPFIDPAGVTYYMQSFNTTPQGDMQLIPPLVVKPLPENEATARPTLRKIAALARSKGAKYDAKGNLVTKGGCYYSFYCYTNPQISAGFTNAAGADAGWAQGSSAAVCSSFIWLCAKASGVPLVTPNPFETISDFSAKAIAAGAQVGPSTLDGLVFYPEADRLQGAQVLYQMTLDQALGKEDGLGTIPGINSTIAGPIADQLINMFAFGNPNMVNSNAWQQPGIGNAISPENITFWNTPYYGCVEPLQYLPKHTEQYTVSKWTKVVTWGTITGSVHYNGSPVPNAHVWVYIPGGETYTDANGNFTLSHIPIGPYQLKAQAVITTNGISAQYTNGLDGVPITLTAANDTITQTINLQGLPANYRTMNFTYSISCDHGDDNPWNTHGVQTAGPFTGTKDVNPGQVTNSLGYPYNYNGGGYFSIDYGFDMSLLEDLSISVVVTSTMYDDSGNLQAQYTIPDPINVPTGGSWSGSMKLENDGGGYHNGPANFTFQMSNVQQTG